MQSISYSMSQLILHFIEISELPDKKKKQNKINRFPSSTAVAGCHQFENKGEWI